MLAASVFALLTVGVMVASLALAAPPTVLAAPTTAVALMAPATAGGGAFEVDGYIDAPLLFLGAIRGVIDDED